MPLVNFTASILISGIIISPLWVWFYPLEIFISDGLLTFIVFYFDFIMRLIFISKGSFVLLFILLNFIFVYPAFCIINELLDRKKLWRIIWVCLVYGASSQVLYSNLTVLPIILTVAAVIGWINGPRDTGVARGETASFERK